MNQPPTAATAVARILHWREFRNPAGTMLGFFAIELPDGMIIRDCKLMIAPHGRYWVAMPAVRLADKDGRPVAGRDGKPLWNQFVDFADNASRSRFQTTALGALRQQHPHVFDDGGSQ